MSSEAKIHFELYRHLQNTIDAGAEYYGTRFTNADPECDVGSGYADIVIETDDGTPFLVIEAKREPVDEPDRNIDPYSPVVIDQAVGYAVTLGAPYFATYNGNRLVLFKTFDPGTHLLDRRTRAYEVEDISEFSSDLLREVAGVDADAVEWNPHHRAFIKRLKTFHNRLSLGFQRVFDQKLRDSDFQTQYETWIDEQGWSDRYEENLEGVREDFISQTSYLLMNRLVFYKLLEDTDAYDIPEINLQELVSPEKRQEVFDQVVEEVDFEAVYEQDPIFDALPLDAKAETEVEEMLGELERYNLEQFDHDVIGQIYEEIIPATERYALGQFYTPPEVVELITRATVQSPEDEILDPGCGSGGFLVAAYNHIKSSRQEAGLPTTHQGILNQISGIDINRFPAHLSAINLALQDLNSETSDTGIFVRDFFDIRAGDEQINTVESAGPSGESRTVDLPYEVDAIIGNPPYIEHGEIAEDVRCREHLERVGAELNEQSDIYSYFFTHATEFLSDSGHLGFITSNKWLGVRYGEALKQFFLDNFKIRTIVNPRRRVFEGQLVPTCITILEKCEDRQERDNNLINFIQIKEQMDVDEILEKIETQYGEDELYVEENYRVLSKQQGTLQPDNKWTRYLFAPTEYWELVKHPHLTELNGVSDDIGRGTTTGNNDFFFVTEDDLENWPIEDRFLQRAIKSGTQFDGLSYDSEQSEHLVLDCRNFVEETLGSGEEVNNSTKREVRNAEERYRNTLEDEEEEDKPRSLTDKEVFVISSFKKDGYDGIYAYLLWGIEQGMYDRDTCLGRSIWFDLGDIKPTQLVGPKNIRGRPFFPQLSQPTPLNNVLYRINLSNKEDLKLIAGFLNSSVGKLFFELQGTTVRGGLVEIRSYELKEFPVYDPDHLSDSERNRIEEAFDALVETGGREQDAPELMNELNRAVLAPFELEGRAEEIAEIADAISDARQQEKEYEVPVELEETGTISISGATRIGDGGQASLTDF